VPHFRRDQHGAALSRRQPVGCRSRFSCLECRRT
jgi:hypothetical protein